MTTSTMNLEADPAHHSHSRWTWGVQKFFRKVVAGVRRLIISGEPKHNAKVRTHLMFDLQQRLTRDAKKPKVDREYITKNQPWPLDALPSKYLHYTTKWYPPVFCLGVALSFEETVTFAERLGFPSDEIMSHVQLIAAHLTEACGADPPVMVKRGDKGGGWRDHIWLISLATNYDVSEGLDVTESFRKYREMVKKVFGPSMEAGWWLEYMANHNPDNWRVSDLLL